MGRADSEVAERWLEDHWRRWRRRRRRAGWAPSTTPSAAQANFAVLTRSGAAHHYAGNPENPVFTFRLGTIGIASTALYSIDRSLFTYAARGATNRALARLHATVTLDEAGRPVATPAAHHPSTPDRRRDRGRGRGPMTAATGVLGEAGADVGARPTALLPIPQLVRISLYWLGLTAIDAAVGLFITNRLEFDDFVAAGERRHDAVPGRASAARSSGSSSSPRSATSATSPSAAGAGASRTSCSARCSTSCSWPASRPPTRSWSLAAFVILLSFSTNIARGPFQGYVPDLVAEPQVGLASGLVGMMQIVGNVTGFLLVSLSVRYGDDGRCACSRSRSSSW